MNENRKFSELRTQLKDAATRSAWLTLYSLARARFLMNEDESAALADAYTYGEKNSFNCEFAQRTALLVYAYDLVNPHG